MSTRLEAALAELAAAIREEVAQASGADAPERLYDVRAAGELLGIGRSLLMNELAAGRIRSVKVGRRRLVPASAITERTKAA